MIADVDSIQVEELIEKIQILETELNILNTVKTNQEQQVIEGYAKMDSMLSEIESKRNDLLIQNETIRKSGEFIERVIDTMDEILIVLSTDQTILKVNKKFLQIMGFSEAEVIEKTPDFLFSKESLSKIEKLNSPDPLYKSIVYRIFTIKKNFEWVVELISATGEKLPHLFRGSPLTSRIGKKEGMVLVGADIRELTKIQKDLMDSMNQVNEMLIKMNVLTGRIQKYVPEQLVEVLLSDADIHQKKDYSRKKLTIFFSDIVGFTEISDKLDTDLLAEVLNDYLNEMVIIANKHGGTIDKFIGDAIVVFFGDPVSKGESVDAIACVNMALEMKNKIVELRNVWHAKGIDKSLEVRIGINTGFVTVGDFGSEKRKDYTMIGKEANIAARLQTAANPDSILISESTQSLIKHKFKTEDKGKIQVKGISDSMQVFELHEEISPHDPDWKI